MTGSLTTATTSLTAVWFVLVVATAYPVVWAFTVTPFCCPPNTMRVTLASTSRLFATDPDSLLSLMSDAVSKSLNRPVVELEPTVGGGVGGGGGASVSAAKDKVSGDKYFVKTAPIARGGGKMLRAEYLGIKEMAETKTIKVPEPIAYGEGGPLNTAFVIFEYLDMGGGGSAFELGVQLAKMHKSMSSNGQHGFHVDNTIGATPQPNAWVGNWADFWDDHRLGHMLKLTGNLGYGDNTISKLRQKTRELLDHDPAPSLLHGDLWGGNKGYAKIGGETLPVIFDPATYYGCRETDLAMTGLFGGFSSDFYEGYNSEYPLPDPEAYNKRKVVYNLVSGLFI